MKRKSCDSLFFPKTASGTRNNVGQNLILSNGNWLDGHGLLLLSSHLSGRLSLCQ